MRSLVLKHAEQLNRDYRTVVQELAHGNLPKTRAFERAIYFIGANAGAHISTPNEPAASGRRGSGAGGRSGSARG